MTRRETRKSARPGVKGRVSGSIRAGEVGGRAESAGINRHRVGDERAPHNKDELLHYGPESYADSREAARNAVDRGKRRPAIELRSKENSACLRLVNYTNSGYKFYTQRLN